MNALSEEAGAAGAEAPQDMSSLYMASLSFDLDALDFALDVAVVGRADGQAMRVGIDSGVARSVVPNTWYTDYPVEPTAESRARVMYRTVTGAEVVDEVLRSLAGWTSTAVEPKHVRCRVADVSSKQQTADVGGRDG